MRLRSKMRPFIVELTSWCWWTLVPGFVRDHVANALSYSIKKRIDVSVKRFLAEKTGTLSEDEREVVEFLKEHPCQMLPYPFALERRRVTVYRDRDCRLPFVMHEDKRLYFPRTWAAEKIKVYYNGLSIEQHADSPHRYEMAPCMVKSDDVVVDAGASEGFFALGVVDRCRKIYLIECDALWSEALRRTFSPWTDKVVFLEKWLSDCDDPEHDRVTLDTCLAAEKIGFLKADIEGCERQLLEGARRIMARSENMRMAICTYHTPTDAKVLEALSKSAGFHTSFSHGFTVWASENDVELRRGVLRAIKGGQQS